MWIFIGEYGQEYWGDFRIPQLERLAVIEDRQALSFDELMTNRAFQYFVGNGMEGYLAGMKDPKRD